MLLATDMTVGTNLTVSFSSMASESKSLSWSFSRRSGSGEAADQQERAGFLHQEAEKHKEERMNLKGRRIAILAENMYQEMELWVPYYRMKEEGAEVKVVGAGGARSYTSKHGYPVTVDVQADAVTAVEFDAVVVPGGYAPDMMRRHEAMVQLVRDAVQQGKVVAAICHAGWMLASAGVVKGKKVTSFFSIKDDMVNAGAQWLDSEVVVDGNIVTARKPDDLPAFCREIVRALAKTS
jgi:deglycase